MLVLPYIKMNPPQVYMCSTSWTLLPPPSPYHPSVGEGEGGMIWENSIETGIILYMKQDSSAFLKKKKQKPERFVHKRFLNKFLLVIDTGELFDVFFLSHVQVVIPPNI